jgi:predicted acetyltransferase
LSIEIRPVTPDDDLDAELDLSERAFGPSSQDHAERLARAAAVAAAGRQLGAFDDGRLVASAEYHDMRQWWRGRPVPMAGVGGVKVAPEERGRGVGRALMTGLLERMAAGGFALSVLFPATSALYRSLGWEMAGGQYEVRVPSRSLRRLLPGDFPAPDASAVRRAGPGDADAIMACLAGLHAASLDCGPLTYAGARLGAFLATPGLYAYQAADGVLLYRWNRRDDEVLIYLLAAGSAATTRLLWSIVASHGTMADYVRARVSPDDPITWLVPEPDVALSRSDTWMLRVLDAPAAIEGRGFPEAAGLAVPLTLADDQLPGNTGHWLLEVAGGKGTLTRGRSAGLRLGPRGLAALYAGAPLATLRRAGLAEGGTPGADAALDTAFAATAYMTDFF